MPSIRLTMALVLAGYVFPVLLTRAHAQANPACTLLTLDEIRKESGQSYDSGVPGDELEGGFGRASCQWGGASFMPGEEKPMLSVVLIPNTKNSYAAGAVNIAPRKGCAREKLSGVGDVAFMEFCEKDRGPTTYANVGKWDLMVEMDVLPPATAASVKPAIVAVAKAAAARLRTKT
jgi:hypothetical protein